MVKKVAVTGSSGSIGKVLVKVLNDNGFKVIQGNSKNVDVTKISDVKRFVEKCDVLIHLAVYQNVFDTNYDNFEKVNVHGTKNVLEVCKEFKKKVILFSSEVVFRNSSDLYTKSKKAQLEIAKKYSNVEIIYPPVVLDLKQKYPWWKLMPGGIMASIGDGNKVINYIDIDKLCVYVVNLLKSNNKTSLSVEKMSRKNFLIKINNIVGGFRMPFRIPIGVLKFLLIFLRKTKYRLLLESVIENER